jgi:hypothetical protein
VSQPHAERDQPREDAPGAVDLDERKERVLHTRVPESLDRHIKRRARSLGMSVSTVVRNVLLTTFGLVEDIVNDSTDIALAITGQAAPARDRARGRVERAEILGWQEAILNLNAVCEDCNAILPRGSRAAIGVGDRPGPRPVICRSCLGNVGQERGVATLKRRR